VSEADKLFTDGEAYERLMGRWSRLVGEQFLDWLEAPKNLRWLDVGCGNGAFTEELIAHCAPASVMGIDPSDQQLAYARRRGEAKMAEFRVADARNLPFGDDSSMPLSWPSLSPFFQNLVRRSEKWHVWCGPVDWLRPTCGTVQGAERQCTQFTWHWNQWV